MGENYVNNIYKRKMIGNNIMETKNKKSEKGQTYLRPKHDYKNMDENYVTYIYNKNMNQNTDYSKMTKEDLIKMLQIRDQKDETKKLKKNKVAKKVQPPKKDQEMDASNEQQELTPLDKDMIEILKKDLELETETDKITEKYESLFKKRKIIKYPKESVSVDEFRREEATLTGNFRKDSSFVSLFEDRLDNIEGEREPISITIYVTITTGLIDENKTYGPFETEVPQLSRKDMYKFMVYTLMENDFMVLSAQVITKVGCKILTHNKQFFMDHFMEGVKLESHLLSNQRKIKSHGKNTCVVDYVWDQVRGKRGFKTYDYKKLKGELMSYVTKDLMDGSKKYALTTRDLISWAKECHPNVSIHAYDSCFRKFITHSNNCSDISLVYIVKDHHCFPITNEKLKQLATKANQGGAQNLLKYMSELKWSRRNEDVQKLESVEDVTTHGRKKSVIILPVETKMSDAITAYIKSSNYYVEYLHWSNSGFLDGFMDDKQNMYLLNDNYDQRESICRRLFEKFQTDDYIWSNQSYTKMATSIFQQMCGKLPESTYNIHTRQILDDHYPRALQWCTPDKIPKDVVSIDISKCYPSILLNNKSEIPLYSIHDTIEPFGGKQELSKCGEFYLDYVELPNFGSPIKIEAGFYSSDLVYYLVEELNMPTSYIKYQITTKRALKPDTFKKYFEYLFNNFPESEAKQLANSFIGELGRKYNRTNTGFTCTEYDTAMCCWTRAMSEGRNVTVDHFGEIFLIKEQKCERIFSDHTSVNRFVVSTSILRLLQLIRDCRQSDSKLYGYNTDGIFITNPKKLKHKKDVKFETKNIGKAYVTNTKLVYFEKKYRENIDYESYEVKKGEGCIFNGQAGSGKTTKLCEMVSETENPLVLSFTNKAIENVKRRLSDVYTKKGVETEVNKICHTFDSYFCEWNETGIDSLKNKTIFVEEFSMVPNKWMTLIYEAFIKFNNKVFMFGDPNQCEPVEGGSQIHYSYLESDKVTQMYPNKETLQYVEGSCRYDRDTHNMLSTFLTHGKVSAHFEPIGNYYKNICFLNSTRRIVNENCCERFTEDKNFVKVMFRYNGGRELYRVCVGMPMIATQNLKDENIFNTMAFELEDIRSKNDHEFKIGGHWFSKTIFSQSFIPAFCVTVYKFQGCDIDEHYNIYDVRKMDKKQMYTALSRTTKFEYIHLVNSEVNRNYYPRSLPEIELTNAKKDDVFMDGKIYEVKFSNGKIYVGSTCENLETRLKWHLSNSKSQVYKFSKFKPKINLIVNAPSFDKKKLEEIECKWIEWYANKYTDNLLNEKYNPSKKKQRKKLEHEVVIENHKQLQARVEQLEGKIKIKDNNVKEFWYYDTVVNGKRHKTMARYNDKTKKKALKQISAKKQELIKDLTVDFE